MLALCGTPNGPESPKCEMLHFGIWLHLDLTRNLNLKFKERIRCVSTRAVERRLAHLATTLTLRDNLQGDNLGDNMANATYHTKKLSTTGGGADGRS